VVSSSNPFDAESTVSKFYTLVSRNMFSSEKVLQMSYANYQYVITADLILPCEKTDSLQQRKRSSR